VDSLQRIRERRPTRLLFSHFGPVETVEETLAGSEEELRLWVELVRDAREQRLDLDHAVALVRNRTALRYAEFLPEETSRRSSNTLVDRCEYRRYQPLAGSRRRRELRLRRRLNPASSGARRRHHGAVMPPGRKPIKQLGCNLEVLDEPDSVQLRQSFRGGRVALYVSVSSPLEPVPCLVGAARCQQGVRIGEAQAGHPRRRA
jgi:hypothetical protein